MRFKRNSPFCRPSPALEHGSCVMRFRSSAISIEAAGSMIALPAKSSAIPSGAPFDFQRFRGGPLFLMRKARCRCDQVFIGHTVCPGFADIAGEFAWWSRTAFHVPGYDYLHEGHELRYTPIDLGEIPVHAGLASGRWSARRWGAAEAAHRPGLSQSARPGGVLLPLLPGRIRDPTYNTFKGRPLASVLVPRLPVRERTAVLRKAVHLLPGNGRSDIPAWCASSPTST